MPTMPGYLALWCKYRHNLLEPILDHKQGIRASELYKNAKMCQSNFKRVIRLLEYRKLITRRYVKGSNGVYILPTTYFIQIVEENTGKEEFAMMDVDEFGQGIVKFLLG